MAESKGFVEKSRAITFWSLGKRDQKVLDHFTKKLFIQKLKSWTSKWSLSDEFWTSIK